MSKLILTSAFGPVAKELREKDLLPTGELKVAFIPTAADFYKSKPWMEADRQALIDLGYTAFEVALKGQPVDQLRKELEPANIIFVAGGNTTYLTERAQASGLPSIIHELLKDRMYIGSSAGSILAGPSVAPFVDEDLSELPNNFVLKDPTCLGLVDYIILPHYPSFAEENEKVFKKFGDQFTFIKITDQEYRIESP